MSEGTRDQLYLALRLAYLEEFASRSEPPFLLSGTTSARLPTTQERPTPLRLLPKWATSFNPSCLLTTPTSSTLQESAWAMPWTL